MCCPRVEALPARQRTPFRKEGRHLRCARRVRQVRAEDLIEIGVTSSLASLFAQRPCGAVRMIRKNAPVLAAERRPLEAYRLANAGERQAAGHDGGLEEEQRLGVNLPDGRAHLIIQRCQNLTVHPSATKPPRVPVHVPAPRFVDDLVAQDVCVACKATCYFCPETYERLPNAGHVIVQSLKCDARLRRKIIFSEEALRAILVRRIAGALVALRHVQAHRCGEGQRCVGAVIGERPQRGGVGSPIRDAVSARHRTEEVLVHVQQRNNVGLAERVDNALQAAQVVLVVLAARGLCAGPRHEQAHSAHAQRLQRLDVLRCQTVPRVEGVRLRHKRGQLIYDIYTMEEAHSIMPVN
mmetsp:Transcript_3741/g.11653  ORF Transcript_3741/g.11653 Transcript_3741/m.11653 type:complete len:353 (+) Transcript_3741:222-1280(+)